MIKRIMTRIIYKDGRVRTIGFSPKMLEELKRQIKKNINEPWDLDGDEAMTSEISFVKETRNQK